MIMNCHFMQYFSQEHNLLISSIDNDGKIKIFFFGGESKYYPFYDFLYKNPYSKFIFG